MEWSLETITSRLAEIKAKGFISIPDGMHRTDDGIVGQILEREFNIEENNLRVGDLGEFELKGMRKRRSSQKLTLGHKSPESGFSTIEIFDRFGYIRPSGNDPSVMKKKLFAHVKGTTPNSVGFRLVGQDATILDMMHGEEHLCRWNLAESLVKYDKIILAIAETSGERKSPNEQFHYRQAFLLSGLNPLDVLVNTNVIVVDFCVDQTVDETGTGIGKKHDRGVHIRVPVSKLRLAYREMRPLLT